MVESVLGRRRSLAATTLFTAFFCVIFVLFESPLLVRLSSVGISLSATVRFGSLCSCVFSDGRVGQTMYAVLYG